MGKTKKEFEYEYNPIKEKVAGEKALKVVWSTKVIDLALDGLNKGYLLKANPFIGNLTYLLRPELVFKRTKEELDEYIKCMQDVKYFAKYCKLKTPKGLQYVTLRDYQEKYLDLVSNNRFTIFLSCRQSGKSTTTAIHALHHVLFNCDINALILSKSGPAGLDLLAKIKDMYRGLPYFLKIGSMKWNLHEISFDNNSSLSTEAFSSTAGLGKTINFLILDEFAWTPPSEVELFYNNIIPTITTMPNSHVCIMSTQNGFNFFYKIWTNTMLGKTQYAPFKVDWDLVPEYDLSTGLWKKRDEAWKEMMIGVLGGESEFYYQYGTHFSASDKCLVNRTRLAEISKYGKNFMNVQLIDDFNITLLNIEGLFFDPDFDLSLLKTGYFLILIDLAEGGGNDYTIFNIIQIINKKKFVQVGYWRMNTVKLEQAAVNFWMLHCLLFNNERCCFSIEWNTYGALFYKYIIDLNEPEMFPEHNYRWEVEPTMQGVEMDCCIRYTKGSQEDEILGISRNSKTIPGLKWNGLNKKTNCAVLKMMIESEQIDMFDIVTITELENFEDLHGSGTYKATFGHDDMIMTFVLLPSIVNNNKFIELLEDMEAISSSPYGNTTTLSPFEDFDTLFAPGASGLPKLPTNNNSFY